MHICIISSNRRKWHRGLNMFAYLVGACVHACTFMISLFVPMIQLTRTKRNIMYLHIHAFLAVLVPYNYVKHRNLDLMVQISQKMSMCMLCPLSLWEWGAVASAVSLFSICLM